MEAHAAEYYKEHEYINNSLHLARKYARIFACGNYERGLAAEL